MINNFLIKYSGDLYEVYICNKCLLTSIYIFRIVSCICGCTRRRNFPTASRHKALYLQSVRSTCLMYHRFPYDFFAEYSEEYVRSNRRGHVTNAYVVRISRGNKENNQFGVERMIHSVSNSEMRRV